MQNPEKTILDFLNLIDYQGDKEAYAAEFVELCKEQTFLKLPPEMQQTYMQTFSQIIIENFEELFQETYDSAEPEKQKEMDSFLNKLTGATT